MRAVASEADGALQLDTHRLVERDAGAAQNGNKLRMCAEADAAAGQFLVIALEHHRVPADAAQKMRREQPAE